MENTKTENLLQTLPGKDALKPLRQVALIFFMLIGGTHILTGLMISQNLFLPASSSINKILDIPFAVIAIVYGLSNAHIQADNPGRKAYYLLMLLISLSVLGVMVYITLFIPDRIIK